MADIDKSLYAAPEGLEELAISEEEIEIEIEDPEKVTIGIGDAEIEIEPGKMDIFFLNADSASALYSS